MVEWYWQGKSEIVGQKSGPVSPCPPSMWNGMTRGSYHVIRCKNSATALLSDAANTQVTPPHTYILIHIIVFILHHLSSNPRCRHQGFFTTYIGILFSGTTIPITNSGFHIIIIIIINIIIIIILIPLAVHSKAWVCDRSFCATAGSNSAECIDYVCCERCVLRR